MSGEHSALGLNEMSSADKYLRIESLEVFEIFEFLSLWEASLPRITEART